MGELGEQGAAVRCGQLQEVRVGQRREGLAGLLLLAGAERGAERARDLGPPAVRRQRPDAGGDGRAEVSDLLEQQRRLRGVLLPVVGLSAVSAPRPRRLVHDQRGLVALAWVVAIVADPAVVLSLAVEPVVAAAHERAPVLEQAVEVFWTPVFAVTERRDEVAERVSLARARVALELVERARVARRLGRVGLEEGVERVTGEVVVAVVVDVALEQPLELPLAAVALVEGVRGRADAEHVADEVLVGHLRVVRARPVGVPFDIPRGQERADHAVEA